MPPKVEIDVEWLREKYIDEWLSTSEIAELRKTSQRTIQRRLDEHGIERAEGWNNKPLEKDYLQQEYVDNGRSARELAKGKDYSRNHVQKSLKHHGMKIRTKKEAVWKHHSEHCAYRTHPRGHVMIQSGSDMVYAHQLVAIADGADPHKLFGGSYVVHHKNEIPWDNRPSNLEVFESQADHIKEHGLPGWQKRR